MTVVPNCLVSTDIEMEIRTAIKKNNYRDLLSFVMQGMAAPLPTLNIHYARGADNYL